MSSTTVRMRGSVTADWRLGHPRESGPKGCWGVRGKKGGGASCRLLRRSALEYHSTRIAKQLHTLRAACVLRVWQMQ